MGTRVYGRKRSGNEKNNLYQKQKIKPQNSLESRERRGYFVALFFAFGIS